MQKPCAPYSPTARSIRTWGCPPSHGVDAIVENLAAQFSMFPDAYAFEIVNIASDGQAVLTERLDYIQTPDGAKPASSRHGNLRRRR